MYRLTGEPIILASGSPRRSEMLTACGIPFEKFVSECDESVHTGESPREMVERLSLLKAKTVSSQFPNRWVLGADTTVVLEGEILGKPENSQDAFSMLSRIQGRKHEVWGSFSIVNSVRNEFYTKSHCSHVTMMPIDESSIRAYIETKEPMDKAGSYAIQGIGASLVAEVQGSYTNVVGLNLSAVISAMLELKIITRGV